MSNTLTRILVAVVAIPLILYTVYYGSYPYFAFCLIIEALCFYEFLKMFENKGYRTYIYLNIFISAVLFSVFIFAKQYIVYTPALIFLLFVIEHFRKENRNIFNPFLITFGFVYITLPLSLLYGLGKDYLHVYYLLVLIWSCDSFAFFGGKMFGKHKLSSISPGKTIEGSVSGFVFTVVLSIVFHYIFPGSVTFIDSLIAGAFVGIFAQTGDLLESFLKRYTGVKDSSHIIPGHGGLLDRFDSLIFCVPPVYIYFYFIKIFLN